MFCNCEKIENCTTATEICEICKSCIVQKDAKAVAAEAKSENEKDSSLSGEE